MPIKGGVISQSTKTGRSKRIPATPTGTVTGFTKIIASARSGGCGSEGNTKSKTDLESESLTAERGIKSALPCGS